MGHLHTLNLTLFKGQLYVFQFLHKVKSYLADKGQNKMFGLQACHLKIWALVPLLPNSGGNIPTYLELFVGVSGGVKKGKTT